MRMAERSAEERIELWFQQFDHALKMSKDQFYSNALATYVQPELSLADHIERFRQAGELVGLRADYLRDNPAEVVQDRLDAYAERAQEILQRTAERARAAEAARWAALTPEEQRAEEAERRAEEAMDWMGDPEYLGQLAEERFSAEQDPNSEWYRDDVYHGEMGPDVQADYDRTAEEERLGAVDALYEQEHPPIDEHSEEEEQDWDEREALPPTEDALREAQRFYGFGDERMPERLDIDIADPDLGEHWQAQLDALDARIMALVEGRDEPEETYEQDEGRSD
jgi:hypothetical protein